jgi:hypothetical protein
MLLFPDFTWISGVPWHLEHRARSSEDVVEELDEAESWEVIESSLVI